MKKFWYTVKFGFAKLTAAALVGKARTNVTMLTGNPAYTSPIPSLVTITAAADTLQEANDAYNFNGGRLDKEARDVAYDALKELLKELQAYVQAISKGDKELILSAGCETQKVPSPIGPLNAPPNVRANVTAFPGVVEVTWGGVRGRASYELWITDEDPKIESSWKMQTSTTKNRSTVEGLKSGTMYTFRVVALGAVGVSPASDIASAKVA